MEAQQIKALIDAMASSDLAELEFSQDGWTLRLQRRPPAARAVAPAVDSAEPRQRAAPPRRTQVPAAPSADEHPKELKAPLYGVVHLRPSPDEAPFVEAGRPVRAGQTVCVIEAMKVFHEVRAEFDATVEAVLVSSGQEIEAGQPLLRCA